MTQNIILSRRLDGTYTYNTKAVICSNWSKTLGFQNKNEVIKVSLNEFPGARFVERCQGVEDDDEHPIELDGKYVNDTFLDMWNFLEELFEKPVHEFWFQHIGPSPKVEVGQVWEKWNGDQYAVVDMFGLMSEQGSIASVKLERLFDRHVSRRELGSFVANFRLVE